jgi:GTP cyclohydrolase III
MLSLILMMQAAAVADTPPVDPNIREVVFDLNICSDDLITPFANTPEAHAQARAASRALASAQAENHKADNASEIGRVRENERVKMTTLDIIMVDNCTKRTRMRIERKQPSA